jgi:hypothetical protein
VRERSFGEGKHGRYTTNAIANRRKLSAMLVAMKAILAGPVSD